MSSKPAFNKTAQFKGTDAEYNEAVWFAAEHNLVDADAFRPCADVGLSHGDVSAAFVYLNRPKFSVPQNYKGTDPYNEIVWFLAETGTCSGHAVAPFLQMGVNLRDVEKAWNYLNPRPAPQPAPV